MFTIKNYVVASNLEEAYELLTKNRQNKVLGGTMWMRMGNKSIQTAIDLSGLGLDTIEETETTIEIGAMCTLRQVETHPTLIQYLGGILPKSVSSIVGVQFRNTATIGGSVYSRFGFSDVLTALLGMDAYVELYKGGKVALKDFMDMPYTKDIVVKIIIAKETGRGQYVTERMSATDLPILTVCVTKSGSDYRIVVGARPSRARLAEEAMAYLSDYRCEMTEEVYEKAATLVVEELSFASNMRGSEGYREKLAKVLVKRALKELED
ncbi:MAG: FAD binding domain-containing protein [Cellulosilyticaceae bacterium]